MVSNIFDYFLGEKVEDRMLRTSTRIRAHIRRGVSMSAFLALGIANAYADNPHAPSGGLPHVVEDGRLYSLPLAFQYEQVGKNSMTIARAPNGHAGTIFKTSESVSEILNSEKFSLVYFLPRWFDNFSLFDLNGNIDGALEILMDALDEYEGTGNWSEFSNALRSVSVERFSSVSLVGLLRMSFAQRANIPYWPAFAHSVRGLISSRGEDVERTMSGLV